MSRERLRCAENDLSSMSRVPNSCRPAQPVWQVCGRRSANLKNASGSAFSVAHCCNSSSSGSQHLRVESRESLDFAGLDLTHELSAAQAMRGSVLRCEVDRRDNGQLRARAHRAVVRTRHIRARQRGRCRESHTGSDGGGEGNQ